MNNKTMGRLTALFALGIFGAVVRGWELYDAFDPVTGLYDAGPFWVLLPVLSVLALILSLWVALDARKERDDFFTAYVLGSRTWLGLSVAASLLLCAAGIVKVAGFVSSASFSALIFGVLTVAAGISLAALARARFRGAQGEMTLFAATIPIFWACFLLILTFTEHPVEPVIPVFAYDLLASCALLLALYGMCAALYGRHTRALTTGASFAALYFMLVSGAGRAVGALLARDISVVLDAPFRMTAYFACALYLLAMLAAPARTRHLSK